MMSHDVLFLASQSQARQKLLRLACIPFKVLAHSSDEQIEQSWTTFQDHVLAIAKGKMHTVLLPKRTDLDRDYIFVLTADTLLRDPRKGTIFGKPANRQHAIQVLAQESEGPIEVATGCCLTKYIDSNGSWVTDKSIDIVSTSIVEFYVDKDSVELYFQQIPQAPICAGAGVIEEHGLTYLKSINGSFSGVMGLPLYEVRQALKDLRFKF
jgi:septum formation protein